MQALGIIAEYNPFHSGHLLQLNETKKMVDLPVIAVMSGSFVQRGEPAFADKWLRARMAIDAGVDLVFELPTAFTLRSAEHFAHGGVKLLEATGVTTHLSCGAENAELDYTSLAKKMLEPKTQLALHSYIKKGLSYAQACELALENNSALANKPNNILALEYAKALLSTNIKQLVIPRQGNNYNELTLSQFASATAIRKAYFAGDNWQQAVPASTEELLNAHKNALGYDEAKLWLLLKYKLALSTPETILATTECTEGLENLLASAVNCSSFAEAIAACTNKRYPASRIHRLFMQLLLGMPRSYYANNEPAYIRILAFNDRGRALLSTMKETASLPIITKLGKNPCQNQSQAFKEQLELDIAASNIVALLRPSTQSFGSDYLTSPYYKKE